MTSADKTSDMYRLTKEQYDQLLTNSITFSYEKHAKRQITTSKNKLTWPGKNK